MLRLSTWIISLLLHSAMLVPLMGLAAGNRSFEAGTGDDLLRIEQGIALEGISQFGDAPKTVQAREIQEVATSRAAQEIEEVKAEEPPPEEQPVEELKPQEEPPELKDVITTAAKAADPETMVPETPPEPENIVKPEEIQDVKPPQEKQVAAIEQVRQPKIEEAQSASAKQSGGNATITTAYLGSLRSVIEKNKINPRSRVRGTAVVRFKVDAKGNLLSYAIKKSSGSKVLDRAALDAVRRSAPFPEFPEGVVKKPLVVTVPFRFLTR